MAQFVIVYLGGDRPSSQEEGQKNFAKYMEWLKSLGDSAVSPMNPFKGTQTISPDGSVVDGSSKAMTGYTIIEADSIDSAVKTAKDCPFLEVNGTIEVSEMVQMPG